MQRKSFAGMDCSVAQCLEVVGEWWTLLIVRDAFLGFSRFDQFESRLGIARNVLTQRLEHLVSEGVLGRVPYQERPVRYDYLLTAKGRDLWHVVTAMRQWGDRWAAPAGPPTQIIHDECGAVTTVLPTCSSCGGELSSLNVTVVRGPGSRSQAPPAEALPVSAAPVS